MKHFRQLFLVLITATACDAAGNSNADAFQALCSIYRLALGATGTKFEEEAKIPVPTQAVEEVARLYAITASDEYFEFGDSPLPKGITSEEKDKIKKEWETYKRRWIDETLSGTPGEMRKKYERLPPGPVRELANGKIGRIRDRLNLIKTSLDGVVKEASDVLNESKKLATNAMYGTGQTDVVQASFTTDYDTSCGGAAGSAGPGKSLVNDLLCLCAGKANAAAAYGKLVCGATRFASALDNNHFNALTDAPETGKIVLGACATQAGLPSPTARGIEGALAAFKSKLGAKTHTAVNFEYVLGKTAGSGCVGGAESDQVCVNYRQQLHDKKGDFSEIKWFDSMAKLAEQQAKIKELEHQAVVLNSRLNDLEGLAWDTYHEAAEKARQLPAQNQKTGATTNGTSKAYEGNMTYQSQQSQIRSKESFQIVSIPIFVLLAYASRI